MSDLKSSVILVSLFVALVAQAVTSSPVRDAASLKRGKRETRTAGLPSTHANRTQASAEAVNLDGQGHRADIISGGVHSTGNSGFGVGVPTGGEGLFCCDETQMMNLGQDNGSLWALALTLNGSIFDGRKLTGNGGEVGPDRFETCFWRWLCILDSWLV